MRDALAAEELDEVIDVRAGGLDPVVLIDREVPGEHVDHRAVLGKAGRDLLGQEEVRVMQEGQPARDRVVIGQRDEVHAAGLAQPVLLLRLGVALGAAKAQRVPLVIRRRRCRMEVKIASRAQRR